jgi:hypothetical protein
MDALVKLLDGSESPSDAAATITKAYSSYVTQPLKNSDSDRVQLSGAYTAMQFERSGLRKAA